MVTSHGPAAIIDHAITEGATVTAISYLEPEHEWDSGFALLSTTPTDDTEADLICIDCLLDEHPELGKGLDLAREHGEARRHDDGWRA